MNNLSVDIYIFRLFLLLLLLFVFFQLTNVFVNVPHSVRRVIQLIYNEKTEKMENGVTDIYLLNFD